MCKLLSLCMAKPVSKIRLLAPRTHSVCLWTRSLFVVIKQQKLCDQMLFYLLWIMAVLTATVGLWGVVWILFELRRDGLSCRPCCRKTARTSHARSTESRVIHSVSYMKLVVWRRSVEAADCVKLNKQPYSSKQSLHWLADMHCWLMHRSVQLG